MSGCTRALRPASTPAGRVACWASSRSEDSPSSSSPSPGKRGTGRCHLTGVAAVGSSVACSPRVLPCCFPGPFPQCCGCPEPIRFPPRDPMTLFWEARGGAEGERTPGGLRAVARCLGPAAHEALVVAAVEAGLVVQDAVLLAFVLDSREMKLVVFLVAGPTLPCLARFLLPLQWSHRHRRHVTAPPELLSRAWRRLAWPGGSWPPSRGRPPAPEPVPSGWQ